MNEDIALSGMTVNERPFTKGLLNQFVSAGAAWDTRSPRQIFELIGLPGHDIKQSRNP